MSRISILSILLTGLSAAGPLRAQSAADVEFFEAKVRPILVEHCQKCHGEKKQRGGLRLDSRTAWEKGGDTGPAIVPGKAEKSLLIRMIKPGEETPPQMPPDSRLSSEQVAVLTKWINLGAPDPRAGPAQAAAKSIDWDAAAKHWAFRPLNPGKVPAVGSPIDAYVLARLREKGLQPVPRAEKLALIRRATFTLTGLPPTKSEVEAFLTDDSNDAFAKVVDRLLASPRYGEHQARIWLDVARYGEDLNFPTKEGIVHAWRYRDWVVDAFYSDLPYNRFIAYQIAADAYSDAERDPKHLAALGLFGLGPIYVSNGDPLRAKAEQIDDRVDTLTRGFMALTVSCARCHDHKFDPIPTIDYYSIAGVFHATQQAEVPLAPKTVVDSRMAAIKSASEAESRFKDMLQREMDTIARGYAEKLPDYLDAAWSFQAKKLDEPDLTSAPVAKSVQLDAESFGRMMKYLGRPESPGKILNDWSKLQPTKDGPRVPPAAIRAMGVKLSEAVKKNLDIPFSKRNLDIQSDLFGKKGVFPITAASTLAELPPERRAAIEDAQLAALDHWIRLSPSLVPSHGIADQAKTEDIKVALRGNPYKLGEVASRRFLRVLAGETRPTFREGSGRRQLAEAIADAKNPLTPRVMVNRIWQQHFGRGLVGTPSNFGKLGETPTHPEMLDYLAEQFVARGWSVKSLHREILLSDTFQRGSSIVAANQDVDPENLLLWRMNRRRVTVEGYRDSLLAAAGTLDITMGGKSDNIDDVKNVRRTIYGKISRLDLSQLLRLFDFPDANITSDRRTETTVPQQMLFAMNSPFAVVQAKALANRVLAEKTDADRVRAMYWFALSRPAADAEVEAAVRYLGIAEEVPAPKAGPTLTRLERFAQALLACNEFVYVD